MPDPRDTAYAERLVDTCIGVQPGWQVLIGGDVAARPLLEEIVRLVAERDAYALLRVGFGGSVVSSQTWLQSAPLDRLAIPSELEAHALEKCDALIVVQAPENTRDASGISVERTAAVQQAYRPVLERVYGHEVPWVGCQYPTPALAQDAGLSTSEFADLLYAAVLADPNELRERMAPLAARFDAASEVRIVGHETDLRLSLEGRSMRIDTGDGANVPGGEFFGCPVEDSAEGVITFAEFPAVFGGRELQGIRLRFEAGRVVQATALSNEAFLLETLDSDDGARSLGELGIGGNPGVTSYMRNTLFDEKIDGTVHLALGNGLPDLGGTNVSRIHWDIVKDLRMTGTAIELDGVAVQRDGVWID